jgi:RNA 2',3'-cyclic 3'-phosphodiesterase
MATELQSCYRLFVAVEVPEPLKDRIEQAQRKLRGIVPKATIRWTPREQFHLTLKFLGDVETQRVESLSEKLRTACQDFKSLPVRATRIGLFPKPSRPRVIWVGVEDPREQLQALHGRIDEAVSGYAVPEPPRPFVGHVTLGRIQLIGRAEAVALAAAATAHSDEVFGEWTLREVILFRSELTPQGAVHSVQATVPFRVG